MAVTRHLHRLAVDLRREHRLTHSWRKSATALGVVTKDGRPDPAMARMIAKKGYEPHKKETRDRLGLKPYCFTCQQKIRNAPMKTQDMTIEEWEAAKKRLPAKYKNVKVEIDGYLFDSESEGRRYQELKLLEKAGEIDGLELQPKYPVSVRGKHVCFYSADFRYWDYKTGAFIIEDVKGVKTAVYRLKKKLVEANYGIEIVEISA